MGKGNVKFSATLPKEMLNSTTPNHNLLVSV